MTGTLPAAPTLGTMSSSPANRTLQIIDVPSGPAAIDALWDPLTDALNGRAVIAPVPKDSTSAPVPLAAAIRAAVTFGEEMAPTTALVMSTSGSTGGPRAVELSAAAVTSLTAYVNALAGAPPAWVLAIPPTSIGGLNVLVRAQAAGVRPTAVASLGGAQRFTDTAFLEAVTTARDHERPIAVSLVPAQLPRLLASDTGREALHRCSLVLVGGAALAPEVAQGCAEAGIVVTPTYGMTETSGGCVFDGHPLPGVTARIADVDGRVWLHGPMLATAYRDGRNEAFVDGWLRTNDRGRWVEGRLQVIGRLDDIVTVNGVNVDVAAVEERLRSFDSMPEVVVVAVPDVHHDSTLHAICAGAAPDIDRVRAWVSAALGKAAAPSAIHEIPAFVLTASGKVDRRATAVSVGLQPISANEGNGEAG